MTEILLYVNLALLVIAVTLLLVSRKASPLDTATLLTRLDSLERSQERTERAIREEVAQSRGEMGRASREQRQELSRAMGLLSDANEKKLEALRVAVEGRLETIQTENARQIEQMRQTVDEKLQGTLEKRLGDSFRLVSDRLEQVHKGLGEMQTLAAGVGDLKRVLTNVKTRGTWGEVQLGVLLEQVLHPE